MGFFYQAFLLLSCLYRPSYYLGSAMYMALSSSLFYYLGLAVGSFCYLGRAAGTFDHIGLASSSDFCHISLLFAFSATWALLPSLSAMWALLPALSTTLALIPALSAYGPCYPTFCPGL